MELLKNISLAIGTATGIILGILELIERIYPAKSRLSKAEKKKRLIILVLVLTICLLLAIILGTLPPDPFPPKALTPTPVSPTPTRIIIPSPKINNPTQGRESQGREFTVNIALSSSLAGAEILIDGRPAKIKDQTLTIVEILVPEKETNSQITLKKGTYSDTKSILVNQDNLEIQFIDKR